ncbi:hypothetical protein C922_05239 [Plasmodium inui San Antonio 1]|uniref:Uncharacterized protein n=1 Tax=Plasmodium inui San Antonio 1 TaxID=1237626 RepID=W7A5M1_9APIC|nr:hypothetical protein C922_05239 [Plasmodium inui San Antonio 1]EUD64389.1 hypothetical protein C922_05239 [Plasmodium inui San Antonio 1]
MSRAKIAISSPSTIYHITSCRQINSQEIIYYMCLNNIARRSYQNPLHEADETKSLGGFYFLKNYKSNGFYCMHLFYPVRFNYSI